MSGRITVPMAVYTAEVVATEDLSPTLRRVVLGGQGLAGYCTTGVGDEYIRLLFPAEGTKEPVLPTITATLELVTGLRLSDVVLFTEARYTRHLSQADLHSAFQDHPMALEHFPSGSLLPPPRLLLDHHETLDRKAASPD